MSVINGPALYKLGFRDLISVTPPNAKLAPSSKLSSAQLGKVPGVQLRNGLWVGYDWRHVKCDAEMVREWDASGANIGLRAGNFPAIDIDCDDEKLSEGIANIAQSMLGEGPIRIGRAPKRLLLFKTDHPFARMRLWFKYKGKQHLIEILGEGQQYVVSGIHPATLRPYSWVRAIHPADGIYALPELNAVKALKFLKDIATRLEKAGASIVEMEGDGSIRSEVAPPQVDLAAPSLDAVREAVSKIPNTEEKFADRASYLKMGYAIKASLPEQDDEALACFMDWALQWPDNTVDSVAADWKRMKAPYAVGWSWIAEMAKPAGFVAAQAEFPALPAPLLAPLLASLPFIGSKELVVTEFGTVDKPAPDDTLVEVEAMSDHWLAAKLVARTRDRLRFVPETGRYLVWDGMKWQSDNTLLAEATIIDALQKLVAELPATPEFKRMTKERRSSALKMKADILSAGKVWALSRLLQADRSIAISVNQLDADPWLLNTPAGIIDLHGLTLDPFPAYVTRPHNPDALMSRMTSVSADLYDAPLWRTFLEQTTKGDAELEAYLQRLAGYCLTGLVKEQQLTFLWGPGGNGKSVFVNVLSRIMGDYWAQADANTFVQSRNDKHTADLASLVGARFVTAAETQEGRAWDEQRIKSVTGGDPISARLLYKDFFTFRPSFKLLFTGNYKPILKGTGEAMRRRMHLVPFLNKPAVVDQDLEEKLLGEAPAILNWMIVGALLWGKHGLKTPPSVVAATDSYFEEEDTLGAWLEDRTTYDGGTFTATAVLYQDWCEYANERGEYTGSGKRFSANLKARGIMDHRTTKARGFILKLNETKPFGGL